MIRRWVFLLVCCTLIVPAVGVLPPVPAHAESAIAAAAVPTVASNYGWPMPGWPRVSRPYQPPLSAYGQGHRGVDLVSGVGAPVLAAGDGVVAFAGDLAGRGVVSVEHPDGLRTTYEPVTPLLPQGTVVVRGHPLGVVQAGHSGCPAAACLHWGVRRGEVYLDPLRLLGTWQVRLKPWVD